ncbi:TPA: hypothetical protein QDB04_001956 [Burkholderia vietnamiensis]|nr:hypothetical protein [Burkholderia vietnamiensis]
MANSKEVRGCDVFLVCAMKDEYDQVIEVSNNRISDWVKVETVDNWLVKGATFQAPGGAPIVVFATWMARMGTERLSPRVSLVLNKHHPLMLIMSGICAGERGGANLGDVIFADRVWQYDVGKVKTDEVGTVFQADSNPMSPSEHWIQRLQDFKIDQTASWPATRPRFPYDFQAEWLLVQLYRGRKDEIGTDPTLPENCPDFGPVLELLWKRKELVEDDLTLTEAGKKKARRLNLLATGKVARVEDPPHRLHVATIASGPAVVEDPEMFPRLKMLQRKTLGLEMEANMVASIATAHEIPWLVAKGVSDFGDKFKDDRYREFAARASAESLLALVASSSDLLFKAAQPLQPASSQSIPTPPNNVPPRAVNTHCSLNDSGDVSFIYSENSGIYVIGQAPWEFETKWTKGSDTLIHLYKDPPSIDAIARADDATAIAEVTNAKTYSFTSRAIELQRNEVAVLRNVNGYYAALKITSIEDRTRGDGKRDEVTFEYRILTDGGYSFFAKQGAAVQGGTVPVLLPSATATILRAAAQSHGHLEMPLDLLCDLVAGHSNARLLNEQQVRSALKTIHSAGWGRTSVGDEGLVTVVLAKPRDSGVPLIATRPTNASGTPSPYPEIVFVSDGRELRLAPKPELRGHITDTRTILHPSDAIDIVVRAVAPTEGKLQYRFKTLHNSVDSGWQDLNTWSYAFQEADIREMCDIAVRIRSESNYHAFGEYDDHVTLRYAVRPLAD